MTHADAVKMVQDVLEKLGEHFDAANISVSWKAGNGRDEWLWVNRGTGNHFARMGMLHQAIKDDDNRDTARALGDVILEDADNDG